MPWRVPTFRPRSQPRKPDPRPSSHERGYGSAAWKRLRLQVIARDEGICQICRRLIVSTDGREYHIDHIERKPVGQKAEATPLSGLQLTCRSCHSSKTIRESRS